MHDAAWAPAERLDSLGQQEPAASLLHATASRPVLPGQLCHAGRPLGRKVG